VPGAKLGGGMPAGKFATTSLLAALIVGNGKEFTETDGLLPKF